MCLYPVHEKAKIARKDITVYKVIYYISKRKKNKYESMYQGFRYAVNTLYKTNVPKPTSEIWSSRLKIEVGFHAYRTIHAARRNKDTIHSIVECTIPKGSTYYIGKYVEIVSNQIILKDIVQ